MKPENLRLKLGESGAKGYICWGLSEIQRQKIGSKLPDRMITSNNIKKESIIYSCFIGQLEIVVWGTG